jgi:hypothetical protein
MRMRLRSILMAASRSVWSARGRTVLRFIPPEQSVNIELTRGKAIRIRDGAGHVVHAREGSVWITEENSARDVVLTAGHAFRLGRPGLAIVEAFKDASIFFE